MKMAWNAGGWFGGQIGGSVSTGSSYIVLALVIGILMLMFYFRFGRDKP